MVKLCDTQLDCTFSALSDRTRRRILEDLSRGERFVSELAQPFDMSLPAVSKHLRVLEKAGLLTRRIDGRVHHLRMDPKPLKQALNWVQKHSIFWDQSLDALADYAEKQQIELEEL